MTRFDRGLVAFGGVTIILAASFAAWAKISDEAELADQTMPFFLYFALSLPIIAMALSAALGCMTFARRLSNKKSNED